MLTGNEQRREAATRERLLDAAEMLFAQKGYNGITVREITRKAQCNQAAVNYHFRSKKNLYLEVFKSRWIPRSKRIQNSFWNSLEKGPHPSPALVIRHVVKVFLYAPILDEALVRHCQLAARELAQPGEAFDLIVTQTIEPFLNALAGLLGQNQAQEGLGRMSMLGALSIFGQVLCFTLARSMVKRITGQEFNEASIERLVDHITTFSVNGLQATLPGMTQRATGSMLCKVDGKSDF
jgi:AcrR family transcriptional regulator